MPAEGTADSRRYHLRAVVETLLVTCVLLLLLRTWCVEGLIGPFIVPGGSMFPTLEGVHRQAVCADCGVEFACGSDLREPGPFAICPNCGYANNDISNAPDVPGDRLLVDRSTFLFRTPRQWEVVAVRHPHRAGQILVKRVVGLPGQCVEIREGDVYIDGRLACKSLAEQRALRVPVYDAAHPPQRSCPLPPRWRGRTASTGWTFDGDRFSHALSAGTEVDWCEYHHWRRDPADPGKTLPAAVRDDLAYNQSQSRRNPVSEMRDLRLSFRVERTSGEGWLWVVATDGRRTFFFRLSPHRRAFEFRDDRQAEPGTLKDLGPDCPDLERRAFLVEVSLVDRQFLAAVDGRVLVALPFATTEAGHGSPVLSGTGSAVPLGIGVEGLSLEIRQVRVFRDVYYTHPTGVDARWGLDRPFCLGADEYFVLGDNSEVSDDSRTWPGGAAVPRALLYGKPVVVHFPTLLWEWGGRRFQLPDLRKIRYIR